MANTRSQTLSIRLTPKVKRQLSHLSKATGRSANYLVADAIEVYVQEQERQLESIRRGTAEIESGHYIPHEAMKAWLLSLGSDHEVPPPKCVCGESHDEPRLCK
ncbi:MAG: CopG family ribbon-helix-helix protein [Acidobacteria bacterium]|nr:CopG family ribbon-helix-helix protein [Acidobacteriota bacterium]